MVTKQLVENILQTKIADIPEEVRSKAGFANVLAPEHDLSKVSVACDTEWELLKNAFKPYACGIGRSMRASHSANK